MEYRPSLHLGVVAIEKGAFETPALLFFLLINIIYIYIYIYIYHHVVRLERISQTLSRYFSLSFIASGRSSGLHPVSSHSCSMYVLAGRPAFARPYVGDHRSTSLMSPIYIHIYIYIYIYISFT